MTIPETTEKTTPETTHRASATGHIKDRVRGLASTGNVAAAATGLALGTVRLVLPWPLTKFLAGVAIVITAVWVCKTLHAQFVHDHDQDDAKAETTS